MSSKKLGFVPKKASGDDVPENNVTGIFIDPSAGRVDLKVSGSFEENLVEMECAGAISSLNNKVRLSSFSGSHSQVYSNFDSGVWKIDFYVEGKAELRIEIDLRKDGDSRIDLFSGERFKAIAKPGSPDEKVSIIESRSDASSIFSGTKVVSAFNQDVQEGNAGFSRQPNRMAR